MTERVATHYRPRKVSHETPIDAECPIVRRGKLVSKRYLPPNGSGHVLIHCDCDCGKVRRVSPHVWASGVARCCGCTRKSRPRTDEYDPRGGLRVVTKFKKSSRQPTMEVRLAQSAKWVAA